MKTSVRELRNSMKRVLDCVQRGEEVQIYSRKKPIARIVGVKKASTAKEDYGFGMWKDHAETKDVSGYVRKLRKGRNHDL